LVFFVTLLERYSYLGHYEDVSFKKYHNLLGYFIGPPLVLQ